MSRSPVRLSRTLVLALVVAVGASLALTPAQAAPGGSERAVVAAKAGSCKGFKNPVGMTDKVIRVGNAVDLSGPVPGLYASARQATRAYVAYFNATRRICGRALLLDQYDAKTDAAAGASAYRTMCRRDFAAIGSLSAFDDGGAAIAQSCRLPDVRAASTTDARNACSTCFGTRARGRGEGPNSVPDYFLQQRPAAAAKAAMLYLNVPSVAAAAATQVKVAQARGMTFVVNAPIDVADFNYNPYVGQLKRNGVRIVQFVGSSQQSVRLAKAMEKAGYRPEVYLVDRAAYNPDYVSTGGTAVAGSLVSIDHLPLGTSQTELNRYRKWLAKVVPGARPTAAGLYAWSSAKLFTTQAVALGAKLTRANLVTRLRAVRSWTGGGMHAPMNVGGKHVSPCTRFLALVSGRWVSVGGAAYRCSGVTRVS